MEPEIAEVVSYRKKFNTAAKSVLRQTSKKQVVKGRYKAKAPIEWNRLRQGSVDVKHASRVIPTKSAEQTKPVRTDMSTKFLMNHIKQFSEPNFCGSFWKTWMESPRS